MKTTRTVKTELTRLVSWTLADAIGQGQACYALTRRLVAFLMPVVTVVAVCQDATGRKVEKPVQVTEVHIDGEFRSIVAVPDWDVVASPVYVKGKGNRYTPADQWSVASGEQLYVKGTKGKRNVYAEYRLTAVLDTARLAA